MLLGCAPPAGGVLAACAARRPALINVGRGDLVSADAAIAALDQGWLSHLVADVFVPEPLPRREHPLQLGQVGVRRVHSAKPALRRAGGVLEHLDRAQAVALPLHGGRRGRPAGKEERAAVVLVLHVEGRAGCPGAGPRMHK